MRQVVRHTPDGMVFINGDLALPGCERCRGRIDIQRYVTAMSVDAGTQPGALSASLSLSVPRISGDQLFRDGYNKLTPGLEVHIYMRGYFPTSGYFGAAGPAADIRLRGPDGAVDGFGGKIEWGNVPTYPYYPVFHGVVTNVSYEYSGGEYHSQVTCASLLHFWQYQNLNSEGATEATRGNNSQVRVGQTGINYNNTHPFGMIYDLYRSQAGAQGGVKYFAGGGSNLDAPMDGLRKDPNYTVWSHIAEYWAQRFRNRVQNLRMYGVNGNLFNAAQQAFLGQRGKSDTKNLLKQVQFAEDGTLSNVKDPFSQDIAVAKALGFERSGFDFIWGPIDNPDPDEKGKTTGLDDNSPASLNMLDMYAYTQQSSQIGQMQHWESTYETKLQIAQAVTEATGYEFYQDVDGDLVFKPPFYNLDTSSNRVYRIEDIDIISINFTHSEPEATWIKVKPSYNKGLLMLSNEGSLNREAIHADPKLLAQFGWRGGATLEVTYTTDVRACHLIGMARLDLLNVGINSATLTIPLRPEMRPGIPVYVAFEDSFYYISQLAHGLSFGAQCTTTLQLICRRRKFFAPGTPEPASPGQDINDLIHLDRTDLPPRPIQIHEDGIPRLAGFPNVVMALDPTRLNPKFFAVGAGLPHLDSTDDVRLFFNFVREDMKSEGVFQEVPASQAQDPSQSPSQSTQYRLQVSENEFIIFSIEDLASAYNDLQNARKEVDARQSAIEAKRSALRAADRFLDSQQARGPSTTKNAALTALQQKLTEAQQKLATTESTLGGGRRVDAKGGVIASEGVPNSNLFQIVLRTTQLHRGQPNRRTVDGIPGSDELASRLDLLENLKSTYTATSLPGYYRYYSASHPKPDQQGQPAIFMSDKKRPKTKPTTPSTGGGATPAAIPPAPVPTPVEEVNTDGLTPTEALKAKLKALGVEWVGESRIFEYQKRGGMTIDGKKTIRVQDPAFPDNPKKTIKVPNPTFGQLIPDNTNPKTPEEIKAAPLTEEFQNNIANTAAAGQELNRRLLSDAGGKGQGGNPQWLQALALAPVRQHALSFWRPFDRTKEGGTGVSQHALGIAVDITAVTKNKEAFSLAFSALIAEAQIMYNEGLIGGVGFYPKGGFIHIDVRARPSRWVQWVPKGSNEGFDVTCSLPVGTGQETTITARGPKSGFVDENGISPCGWWQQRLRDSNWPGQDAINARKGNRITPFPANGSPPKEAAPPPPPPPVEPPPPPPPPPPEPIDGPPIKLIEIDLEPPVKVAAFVPPTMEDPRQRPPEADIGEITATKGLIIARGPSLTPIVVSTDKIQTMRWSQFRMVTDMSISGDTPNGGEYSFRRKAFKTRMSDRFFNAAQESNPTAESTPFDMFKELWDLIVSQLSEDPPGGEDAAVPVPRFDPENRSPDPVVDALLFENEYLAVGLSANFLDVLVSAITLPATDAVSGLEDINDYLERQGLDTTGELKEQELDPLFLPSVRQRDRFGQVVANDVIPTRIRPPTLTKEVHIAEFSLKDLRQTPQYAATGPTKQGKKGQAFNATIQKLADAYAEVLATEFANSFDDLQELAMKPSTNREQRLSELTGAFDLAANTVLNDDGFKSTEKGRRTIKVEKFGKTGNPIHSPVRPISDDQGYEHFGSYRYGRGLTIESGGSFAWLHNSDDPFRRLSAQAAEDLVRTLTRVKAPMKGKGKAAKDAQKRAQGELVEKIDELRAEEDALNREGAIALLPFEQQQAAQKQLDAEIRSRAELRLALSNMMMNGPGQEAVNELLSLNPAPDGSVEVIDVEGGVNATQLEIKFSNFAASYTKSGPFKQSVTNAAYRLVDLTNHLQHPDMQACSCKGSASDVALAAFGRLQFASVEGIDEERSPAEAFVAEQIINESVDYFYQQKALRGEVLNPNQTPDAGLFDKLKSQIGTTLEGVRNGFTSTGDQFSKVPEQFRKIKRDFKEAFGG